MKFIKNYKILSLVLAVAIIFTSIVFSTATTAETISEDTKLVGGMVLSKKVEETDVENKYKITLGAYSTGEAYTIKSWIARPVDIILVIDESGSMDYDYEKNISRWEATQNAVNKFIDKIKTDADTYNVHHRIAITTYASNSYIYIGDDSWRSDRVSTSTTRDYSSYVSASGKSNSDYYSLSNDKALLQKIGDEYKAITVSSKRVWDGAMSSHYEYTYTFPDGTTMTSSNASTKPNFGTRGLYTYGTQSILKASLQDVTDPVQLNNIKDTINKGIDPGGGTYPTGAVNLANQIFETHKNDYGKSDKRGKIVIYFTDGMPGDGDSFDSTEAGTALTQFKALKDKGAEVYSVGVFPNANCSNPQTLPTNSGNDNKANRFLFLASSYYPEATAMTGSVGHIIASYEERPYYMSPTDAAALEVTFEKIAEAIHTEYTEVVMTEKAVVKDVITPYFAGPTNLEDIDAYFLPCTGVDPDNPNLRTFSTTRIEPDGDLTVDLVKLNEDSEEDIAIVGELPNDTVIATNFNYQKNWCGLDDGVPRGKKVVIEFYVTVREGFIGGNGVPTNQAVSGLYDDEGRLLPDFNLPMPEPQDVPIEEFSIKTDAAAKHVYLYGDLSAEDMMVDATVTMYDSDENVDAILKLDTENYGLPEWRVNYIDVDTKVPKAPLKDIVSDTKFKVSATVQPTIEEGACVAKSDDSDDTDIYCYVPRITFKDSVVNAGTTPDYEDNIAKIEWVHKNGEGQWVTYDKMFGTEPKLSFEYNPANPVIYDDTGVKNTKVYIDSDGNGTCDTDITSYCLFEHATCDFSGCAFDSSKHNFVVHAINKVGNLVIKNTGDTVDANDTFVYTITSKTDKTFSKTVTVKGKGTAVVLSLPVDEYTVTQDEKWSYNYTVKTNPQSKKLVGESPDGRDNVVTFENNKNKTKNIREDWDNVNNTFKSTGIVASH